MTPGRPFPRCHCPCALCCSVSRRANTPSPVPRSALWNTLPPSPVRVNPHIPQALPAGNGYPGPSCQFGPVRTRVQHWERIAAAVVAADTSPNVPLLGGCDRECRTIPGAAPSLSLCLIPGYPLSARCWRRAGGGGCSPRPLSPLVPCHLCLGLELFVPLPRDPRHRGAAGLLEALPEGNAVSFGSPRSNFDLWGMSWGPPPRHKHFPLRYFSRVQWPWSVWLVTQSLLPTEEEEEAALVFSRALDLVPPPDGPGGKLGDPGDLCLAPGSLHGVPVGPGAPELPLSFSSGCLSLWFQW